MHEGEEDKWIHIRKGAVVLMSYFVCYFSHAGPKPSFHGEIPMAF
jgi:hypothetical protein